MKKLLVLTVILLNFALALYAFNNLRSPLTVAHAADSSNIESCDSTGNTVDTFDPGDPVYVKGSGLEPGGLYYIYIVKDYSSWITSVTHISDLYIVEGPITVDVDAEGNIENQPVLIWESASPGYYDIWADSQTNGEIGFYDESDAIDDLDVDDAGFFVISEMLLITIPVLFAYLIVISLKLRKQKTK